MEATADTLSGEPDDAADPLAKASGENFPVASRLIRRDLRPAVLAFYRFARAADDVADDPSEPAERKLAALDRMEAGLDGRPGDAHAIVLRLAVSKHPRRESLVASARALLGAFRQDARGAVYRDWGDLRAYCGRSADPVGRFLLDLHGEAPGARPPSNALCTALQVLNHLQDLRADRDGLGRVYIPSDWLAEAGARPEHLSAASLSPGARSAVDRTLDACDALLREASPLPRLIASRGLRAQAAATLFLAGRLSARLRRGDPLAARIAPGRLDFGRAGLAGMWRAAWRAP